MPSHLRVLDGWTVSSDSGANSPQTLTRTGFTSQAHYINTIEVAISGASAGADVFVILKEGATVRWKSVIGLGAARGERTGVAFANPIRFERGVDAVLEVAAGGAGVVTHANLEGFTI